MCSNYNTFNWQVPVPVLWEESETGHFFIMPDKCRQCENGRACINGRFCMRYKLYVEYLKIEICNET